MRTSTRRGAALALAGTMLAGTAALTGAGPASATAAQCSGGANGFIDISDSASGTNAVSPINMGYGVTLSLQYGTVSGAQRGWAKINGALATQDQVWMNYSTNGGASVAIQCGPFTAGTKTSKTTAAKRTSSSSSIRFQACARGYLLPQRCTPWW